MKSLIVFFVSITLLAQIASPAYSQNQTAITPEITHNSPPYYEIKVDTTDGGNVVVNFRWQKTIEWLGMEHIFNTPPILCMSKYNADGSLNYSITYMPYLILEYNDTNENGLFDLGLTTDTNWSVSYDSLTYHEPIYTMYPLTPILPWLFEQNDWNWTVTELVDHPIEVNGLETYKFSWNISATLGSFPWTWKWGWKNGVESTLDVEFRYNVLLYPTGPEVKYDFNFSGVSWIKPEAKLALKSVIIFVGEDSPVVKADSWSWKEFSDTEKLLSQRLTISEEVEEKVLAWAVTYDNATVDSLDNLQPISWAIDPIFVLPIGIHPYGTYFDGIAPTGTHKVGFSHQLGLPHFEKYVSQDPVIGLAATLSTITLSLLPGDLLPIEIIIVAVIIFTAAFTIYTKFGSYPKVMRGI